MTAASACAVREKQAWTLKGKISSSGAGSGIGRAGRKVFCQTAHIVSVDINEANVQGTVALFGGTAMTANVAAEADMKGVIEDSENEMGAIDLFAPMPVSVWGRASNRPMKNGK